jgi:hypothetical protein
MPRLLLILILTAPVFLFTSCFKDDEQVTPHVPGNYITDTVALTDNYKNQVYYSLLDSTAVLTNHKDSWDLGFESSPRGWRVILNSSCFMKSAYLANQEFGSVVDTVGAQWLFNPSDGSADSLAIGQWFTVSGDDTVGINRLLVLDRGIDVNGNSRGFNQLVVDSLSDGVYYFRIADFDGSNAESFTVAKQAGANHVLFSIFNPIAKISEPGNTSWDLLFTQYTTLLYTDVGDPYPYLVTGVLLNPVFVEVAVDSITPFADIDFEKAEAMTFTKQADRIGYDWKIYDFDEGTYTVDSDKIYIIRDTKGFLYKLRFIGFYKFNTNRLEKGYPSFEYQKL